MYKENDVIRLIDKLYKNLYLSDDVFRRESDNKYDKFGNIKRYLDRLERVHDRVRDTGRHKEFLKKMYYDRYVIKREDIPESYYNHQQEIALERGYGYLDITYDMKRELQDEIIDNQKKSLDIWLDYFLSEDAKDYPFWAKYWAFQGMLRLGNYDKEKGEFGRRTKDTVSPFVDLNREALAISIDLIIKLLNKEEIEDKELEVLVKSGSFQKIYAYVITHVLKDNKNITKKNDGVWVKYNRGSDYRVLVKSLQGYNTGWCTAGESTAKSQLAKGDFYVYYTLDENDEYKVPRIAIRKEYEKIVEIRGVAENQNIEFDMECVVEEKLEEFPDKEEYYKKVNDMKMLTKIYKRYKDEELTKEELRFLYEIDSKISGFGYGRDSRIDEIICDRNRIRSDISFIFNCTSDKVALYEDELTPDTLYYRGDLDLFNLTSAKDLKLPQYIGGNLSLSGLTDASSLKLPQSVGGTLYLNSLTNANGLKLPENIGGSLDLYEVGNAEGLMFPKSIGGDLYLRSLVEGNGLKLPETVVGSLYLSSLTNASGLKLPSKVGGHLDLGGLTSVDGLELPQYIGAGLNLDNLTNATGINLSSKIGGFLDLCNLTNVDSLVLPQYIGDFLDLRSLKSANGLVLPQTIDGSLYLSGLTSAENLKLPQYVGGNLNLSGLTTAKGLELPRVIGGDLILATLSDCNGLVLPEIIGGSLDLRGLKHAENLILPQKHCAYVKLNRLSSIAGLKIPEQLTYLIFMNGFDITPENIDKYRNKKKIKK